MKKTLKYLPVILFPYVYMFGLAGCWVVYELNKTPEFDIMVPLAVVLVISLAFGIYSFIAAVLLLVSAARGKGSALELSKLNMIIKTVQIPAYVIHFCIGIIGLLMSVWGIPVILWAILIDLITVSLTGTVSVGANISAKKEKKLSVAQTVIFSLLGFVYCADVVISIVFYTIVKHRTAKSPEIKGDNIIL